VLGTDVPFDPHRRGFFELGTLRLPAASCEITETVDP
jgi:hypothetical protein